MLAIFKHDGSLELQPLEDDSLAQLQRAVGGYIEAVSTKREDLHLYCHEEGAYVLPVNPHAAKLVLALEGEERPIWPIHGNLVICGCVDCETAPLSDEQVREIQQKSKL
jgi:hypothetical protein